MGHQISHLAREVQHKQLRARGANKFGESIIGGFDTHTKESILYVIDTLGARTKRDIVVKGIHRLFVGILDSEFSTDMSEEDATELLKRIAALYMFSYKGGPVRFTNLSRPGELKEELWTHD